MKQISELLREARQYVSDAGDDNETHSNSQALLIEIDRALAGGVAEERPPSVLAKTALLEFADLIEQVFDDCSSKFIAERLREFAEEPRFDRQSPAAIDWEEAYKLALKKIAELEVRSQPVKDGK